MTTYVKTHDPNHPITTGFAGFNTTDASNLGSLDIFSVHNYSGYIDANPNFYKTSTAGCGGANNCTGPFCAGSVTNSNLNTKPFVIGENGINCTNASTSSGVDSDAPDNTSDIEFHKDLWVSAFSGGIATSLHFGDWDQTTTNLPPLPPASLLANHRLNFAALSNFITTAGVDFSQLLYPQSQEQCGTTGGHNVAGGIYDYKNNNPGYTQTETISKFVDNYSLVNADPGSNSVTLAYGYCNNRSYWWQTDPIISNNANPAYQCFSNDTYHADQNDAYLINPSWSPTNYQDAGNDPALTFINMLPNTSFELDCYETTNGTQVRTMTAMSDNTGNLSFNLPFGAGTYTNSLTNPNYDYPDYAYVLNRCSNCRTAGTNSNSIGSPNAILARNILQTKLGSNITLGIFPNPTSGIVYLNLSAQNAGNLLVNLSDATGNAVMHTSYSANQGANSFKLDLSTLNSGVYFIHITDENGVTIKNDKLVLMGQ